MTRWECRSCRGTYSDDDGYLHACPSRMLDPSWVRASPDDTPGKIPRPRRRNENLDEEGNMIAKGRGRKEV